MENHKFVGWVPQPNTRGTLDIIYSCATVILTAIWTILHLNVPGKNDSLTQILLRRVRWGILAILAPDCLTTVAAVQWLSARKSVEQMKGLNNLGSWTIVHAFYADSGGFFLQLPEQLVFPVNAECIHFLVSRGYIPLPTITQDEIWDKSKSDGFAKLFVLLQISWIIIQSIARVANGLSISPLEIFTLAFVASTMMSYFFWWNKPQHVKTPTFLQCKFSIVKILTDSGIPPGASYVDSPLDFAQNSNKFWQRRSFFDKYDFERQIKANGHNRTPFQRIPDDTLLPKTLPRNVLAVLIVAACVHSTIHLLGWNFAYPSSIEQLLWRTSTVILPSVSAVSLGITHVLAALGYQGKYNLIWLWINLQRDEPRNKKCLNFWDIFLGAATLCVVVARFYIIVEAIISLRDLPADVFVAVNWTSFLPHV
ncbi:hypothetical protein F5Y10DRAFT_286685 [Nemania abortiva]|nr:hypothetical protein F5Y10DRAFT_286685 [Nemania abortiva]